MKTAAKLLAGLLTAGLTAVALPAAAHDDGVESHHHGWQNYQIEVLSGRADMVSGGDALVRVSVHKKHVSLNDVRVSLNGADITPAFVKNGAANTLTGLVGGMRLGRNELEVDAGKQGHGRADAELTLTNHPIEGPVFSGPHEQPFRCDTQNFNLPGGAGNLGAPLDENCSIATRVDYFYKSSANGTGNGLTKWPTGATSYPADMQMATTTQGKTVPYIVRMETGTINRAIYQIAVLHDPLKEAAPSFTNAPAAWNKRLIYTFGGGCIGGWYEQGRSTGGVTDTWQLSSGYAVASSSLNVFGNNCNDLTTAESMMMVKERFIEAFGPPAHTQGFGCSGGSYQQHQITDNYPGLLDGIIPGCSFPEVGFATINVITDAWLLDNYFMNVAPPGMWTPEQMRQVTGFLQYATAPNVEIGAHRIDPKPASAADPLGTSCSSVPVAQRYDPATNPTGVRCTVYDHTVNVYGRDPATGFARRPLDNEGIQYGLKTLNSGVITVDQFLDLNARIGGFDKDATIVPQRTQADLVAARAAYRTGRLTNAGGGLSETPIIDFRDYNDALPGGDIHVRYHSFSMRKRLDKANGRHDNQVMIVNDNRFGLYNGANPLLREAQLKLDHWITAVKADHRHLRMIDKVVQDKPADLQEGCYTKDATPVFIPETQVRETVRTTACNTLYPTNSFPREVAGADVAADIIKCQRRTPRREDYAVSFTDAQWARLQATFPTGVCDWSKRGYEQQDLEDTWLVFD